MIHLQWTEKRDVPISLYKFCIYLVFKYVYTEARYNLMIIHKMIVLKKLLNTRVIYFLHVKTS